MNDKEKTKITTSGPNPDKETVTSKSVWYKNKIFLIGVLIILLAATSLVYFLVVNRSKSSTQSTVSNTTLEEQQDLRAAYQDPGLPGIKFMIPDGWWAKRVTRNSTTESYTLYSSDAVVEEDYNGISAGTSIRIHARPRDKHLEAKEERPIEAYISRAGAPVLDGDTSALDRNKLQHFTNKNSVELLAYKWGYEGCHVDVLLLGEEMYYSFQVIKGNACPEVGILESDKTIAAFVDSIMLSDSDTTIVGDIFVYEELGKENLRYEVRAPDIAFGLSYFGDETLHLTISGGSPDIHLQSGAFDKLTLGPSKEVNAKSYQCTGCGFLSGTYDSSVQFVKGKTNTTGYKEVAVDTFGSVEPIDAIQPQGQANRYTYVKTFSQGSIVVSFVVEVSDDSPLPSLEADFILKTLDSLKVL